MSWFDSRTHVRLRSRTVGEPSRRSATTAPASPRASTCLPHFRGAETRGRRPPAVWASAVHRAGLDPGNWTSAGGPAKRESELNLYDALDHGLAPLKAVKGGRLLSRSQESRTTTGRCHGEIDVPDPLRTGTGSGALGKGPGRADHPVPSPRVQRRSPSSPGLELGLPPRLNRDVRVAEGGDQVHGPRLQVLDLSKTTMSLPWRWVVSKRNAIRARG